MGSAALALVFSFVPGLPAQATPAPAVAQGSVLDISGVLHMTEPVVLGSPADKAQADTSLTDQLLVQVCKTTATGCTLVHTISARSPQPEAVRQDSFHYVSAWHSMDQSVQPGDQFVMTVRVAGLNIGEAALTAVAAGPANPGEFTAGATVPIHFGIDDNPVVRARSLHQLGQSAEQVAAALKQEFGLGLSDSWLVLFHDYRLEDVNFDEMPGAARQSLNAPYTLAQIVDAAASVYGATATTVAATAKNQPYYTTTVPNSDPNKYTNQDIVNALVASTKLNSPNRMPINTLMDAIGNGLGVTDPAQQLKLLTDLCVPGVTCSGGGGPPCIPGVTCPNVSLVCADAQELLNNPTNGTAAGNLTAAYDDLGATKLFRTAQPDGCGFDLTQTATLLHLAYFGNLSASQQAEKIGGDLTNGAVPGSGAVTSDDLVTALAKALAGAPKTASETLSCVAALGAIKGGNFPLLPTGTSGGVLRSLGNEQALLDNWEQTGAGNGLDKLGSCLALGGATPPFPLVKVHIQFTEGAVPATSAETGRAFVVGRAGWQPQLAGQVTSLDTVRGLPALKTLPVPNLSGPLAESNMLPALALTGGCLWYNADGQAGGCSTAVGTAWSIPGFQTGEVWPSADCPAHGETCGAVDFGTAGGGAPGVGEFTMIVPGIPGALNFEGSTLVNPNLLGCSTTALPAVQAGALAAPSDIWHKAPNGPDDYLSTGTYQILLDGKHGVSQDIYIAENTENHCARITTAAPHLRAHVDVSFLTSVTAVPGALGQTTVAVPSAQGADPAGNAQDFSIGAAGGAGLGAISDLSGITGSGNLFSTLAQAGVGIAGPETLITLMQTGFLPAV